MKQFAIALLLAGTAAAQAAPATAPVPVQQMLYNVNAPSRCTDAAGQGAGDLRAALSYCDVAMRDPLMTNRAGLLVNRGIIHARLGDHEAALADYDAAIAINPELGDAYVNRGALLAEAHRFGHARSDFETAIRLGASSRHVAWYGLGSIADQQGDFTTAYRDYRKAVELRPDYAPPRLELSRFRVADQTPAKL